jgi:viologen exporter family transport system permease protein
MRLLWEVARRSFHRWSTYRLATAAGVVTNTAFGYLRAYILIAVAAAAGGTAGGWDEATLVTFSFFTQALIAGTGAFGEGELAERVRTGDVVVDLYRPVDLQAWWLASWLGRSAFLFLGRGIPPLLLGAVVFDLVLPDSPAVWAGFLVSTALACVIGFALRFCSNLTAFWLLDNRGSDQILTLVTAFFGGLLLPIVLYPPWLEAVCRALPFAAVTQYPAEIFLGRHEGIDLLGVLVLQAAWSAALLLGGRMMLAAATRKVVIQGG